MPWFIDNPTENEFVTQIEELPDRMAGLLLPILIDQRLEKAIKAQWQDGNAMKELFRDGGALGSFGTRIHLGFAIRIYGEDAYRDLRNMNKIRNDFAHKLETADFESQSIRSRIGQFRLLDRYPVTKDAFDQTALQALINSTDLKWQTFALSIAAHSGIENRDTLRGRFLRTAELILMFLSCAAVASRAREKPNPLF